MKHLTEGLPVERTVVTGVRLRIAHSKTQRDGWGYETTVELTDALPDDDDGMRALGQRLAALLVEVDVRARDERNRRADVELLGLA